MHTNPFQFSRLLPYIYKEIATLALGISNVFFNLNLPILHTSHRLLFVDLYVVYLHRSVCPSTKVVCIVGYLFAVDDAKRKWKSLKDTYNQRKKVKPKSGSGGRTTIWRYFKDMMFLDEFNEFRQYVWGHYLSGHPTIVYPAKWVSNVKDFVLLSASDRVEGVGRGEGCPPHHCAPPQKIFWSLIWKWWVNPS